MIETIPRLIEPEETHVEGMMFLAVLGIIFNGAAALRLKKGKTANERVVSLHMMEDVLGWTAILIGSIVMYFFDIPIIDPILSMLIALYILSNVYKNLKSSLSTFLQNVPQGISIDDIETMLESFKEVKEVHDLHIWSMDGEHHILTAHLVIEEGLNTQARTQLKTDLRKALHERHIDHATLEFEASNADCGMQDC